MSICLCNASVYQLRIYCVWPKLTCKGKVGQSVPQPLLQARPNPNPNPSPNPNPTSPRPLLVPQARSAAGEWGKVLLSARAVRTFSSAETTRLTRKTRPVLLPETWVPFGSPLPAMRVDRYTGADSCRGSRRTLPFAARVCEKRAGSWRGGFF
jgi:hypothetical protein